MKILIIEDEILLADSLRAMLEGKGFSVEAVHDGETGAEYAETGVYDLLILDVMMPGMDAVTLSENLISFEDHASVSGYAVPAMQWAVGQGLINGTDGKLLPTGTATRCQFAAILNRFTASQSEKA